MTSRAQDRGPTVPARYLLERELQAGSLETVYLAQDRPTGRRVVVHVLREDVIPTLDVERGLARLAAAARLQSPHILPLLDHGRAPGILYYVVPVAPGVTVRDKLDAHGPAPMLETLRICRGVLRGLADAHREGVVHLDVSPNHIVLADPEIRLMSLGIRPALAHAAVGGHASQRALAGVSEYSAPEQVADDGTVDERTDIYAVGAVAYELLTGRPPFVAMSPEQLARDIQSAPPAPITAFRPDVAAPLSEAVERCLMKRPEDRWPSAEALLERLNEVAATPAVAASVGSATAGDRIGPYRIVGVYGEGGMGVVLRAEQVHPVRRPVALKLIRLGMDTKEVIARFEAERQALALLDHPNIAKVMDAGATATGRPYFVMEPVDGVPLTAYCDGHRLTVDERITLFVAVCRAVQHAHHKGIVHRDLKPGNVLVVQDERGNPIPKVIDFGLAKAIGHRLTDRTLATARGQLLGTTEYMSPEQATSASAGVDTRSDIYALGTMLYELLTGTLPLDREALEAATDLATAIRNSDPPRPSARYQSLGALRHDLAVRRRTQPAALAKRLAGDLDWIIIRAIEREPERRYQTVEDLARDLERHLADDPVSAGPPSAAYRIRKFVRRHRVGVSVGAVAAASLLLGLAGTTLLMVRARRAERAAEREAQVASQVSGFLVNLFTLSDPEKQRGDTVTARALLDKGAGDVGGMLTTEPLVQARLLTVMADAYSGLALFRQAATLHERALRLLTQELGPTSPEVGRAMLQLADDHGNLFEESMAEGLTLRGLTILEKALPADHPDIAEARDGLAVHYLDAGRYAEAEPLLRRSLASAERTHPPTDSRVGRALMRLGLLYAFEGKYVEAEPLMRRSLAIRELHARDDQPSVARSLINLSMLLTRQGRLAEAESVLLRSIEVGERYLGPYHVIVATSLENLGAVYVERGQYDQAVPLFRRATGIRDSLMGPNNPTIAVSLNQLGIIAARRGRPAAAEGLYRRALALMEAGLGPDHPHLVEPLDNLADALRDGGKRGEADRVLQRALAIARKAFPPENPYIGRTLVGLATLLAGQGRYAEADSLFREGLSIEQRALVPTHPELRRSAAAYAQLLRRLGRTQEARRLTAGFPPSDPVSKQAMRHR